MSFLDKGKEPDISVHFLRSNTKTALICIKTAVLRISCRCYKGDDFPIVIIGLGVLQRFCADPLALIFRNDAQAANFIASFACGLDRDRTHRLSIAQNDPFREFLYGLYHHFLCFSISGTFAVFQIVPVKRCVIDLDQQLRIFRLCVPKMNFHCVPLDSEAFKP